MREETKHQTLSKHMAGVASGPSHKAHKFNEGEVMTSESIIAAAVILGLLLVIGGTIRSQG